MSLAILYGTEDCHLCDDAKVILQNHNIAFQFVDILSHPDLMQRYQFRIPVLVHNELEIDWPFGEKITNLF